MNRDITVCLKGITVLLMLSHHFFAFPQWQPRMDFYDWSLETFTKIGYATKITAAILAFISGYAYCYAKKKNCQYSLKKIGHLLLRHLIVAIPLTLLSLLLGVYSFHPGNIVLECLGVRNEIMVFSWYVYFYIFLMLALPVLVHFLKDHPAWILISGLVLGNLLSGLIYANIPHSWETIRLVFTNCWIYFQISTVGYCLARWNVGDRFRDLLSKLPSWLICVVSFAGVVVAFLIRMNFDRKIITVVDGHPLNISFLINEEWICTPLLLFSLCVLLTSFTHAHIRKALSVLGKYSAFIWFWHALFFGVLGQYTRNILYAPKYPILVLAWGTLISLGLAFVSDRLLNVILRICAPREPASSSRT